jgi:Cu(I)/Ag(I) efflux system membrane protein CusA/SilA
MIDRIIELSIRHRGLVIAAGAVLALWGIYAVYQTPMDAVPDLSENQVIVFTEWPGHSPREIEDQVTYPLSQRLQSLAGVRAVRGSSDVNYSMIHLIFDDATSFATARSRVQERLSGAADLMPAGVVPHMAPDAIPTGQIFWYTLEGGGYDLARLRSVQDFYVRGQLEAVAGVAEVASVGGQVLEYHVDLDPLKVRDRGVELRVIAAELARANAAVGGDVVHKGNAEYIVRGVGWLGNGAEAEPDPQRVLSDLETLLIPTKDGTTVFLRDIAWIQLGTRPRRGILERDGSEVTGGVVLIRHGENPLEVTRRLKAKIRELEVGMPTGVRIVPCYDRTPLIEGAIATVTGTLIEAIVTATVCVVLVLLHLRTSFVIAITLPLAALTSFVLMWLLRRLGIADIQTNIMSLAGISISIGVLVDSSIVVAENVMHHLREKFGDEPVRGDIRPMVLRACQMVGRPIFFSVMIMLISFLPVFALSGIDGRMYRPLAFTKSFALLSVAILAVTLVPALCTIFIRGRMRRETDSWLVRSVIDVYRPMLSYLLDHPGPLIWILGATFLLGTAPLGSRTLLLAVLFGTLVLAGWLFQRPLTRVIGMGSLIVLALVLQGSVRPIQTELRMPLDEGMVMDMPITIPRASSVQSGDDLKARDMQLCRFPEVDMVLGKAGRAESAFDPAPLDMIETMIMFRPREHWPERKLDPEEASQQTRAVLEALVAGKIIDSPVDRVTAQERIDQAVMTSQPRFDAVMREFAFHRNQEFLTELRSELTRYLVERTAAALSTSGRLVRPAGPGEIALAASSMSGHISSHLAMSLPLDDVQRIVDHTIAAFAEEGLLAADSTPLDDSGGWLRETMSSLGELVGATPSTFFTRLRDEGLAKHRRMWSEHIHALNAEIRVRAATAYTRIAAEELLLLSDVLDPRVIEIYEQILAARNGARPAKSTQPTTKPASHHGGASSPLPIIDPHPVLDKLFADLSKSMLARLSLTQCDREELAGRYGGELDVAMQMPGWTNVWTRPIQNRVDMLATGINTEVGVRVMGPRLEDVVDASEAIAEVLREIPGAADVIADPIRGKGYIEIVPNRELAARHGVIIGDVNDVIGTALGGTIATTTVEGRERHAVRVRFQRDWTEDEQTIRRLPISVRSSGDAAQPRTSGLPLTRTIPLEKVAEVRVVEGPATIKSENGLLRNYVRLNVRNRDAVAFVEEARRAVSQQIELPPGLFVEWTGQFEHVRATRRSLAILVPTVVGLIFLILYLTYRDLADAVLMLLAVPGAVAGGVIFQWLFGYEFSMAVGVGYIACFGMAASTGMIMLVYLRDAVERAGGLQSMSAEQLREAVMNGAVHRLRPKLLTEATTILGLAPMLWADGVGAEVIRPMAAPVLGGLLVADEVIDLLLPMMFYHVRRTRWERLHRTGEPPSIAIASPDGSALAEAGPV